MTALLDSPPRTSSPPLVLVVDDDEDTRLNLCDILELDGYRVEVAGSMREVLARENWDEAALMLLDRQLADGTAQELLPQVRLRAPHVAVIMVTGYADVEGAIAALRNGAVDYILKPINPEALRASVRRVLDRKRAQEQIARLQDDLRRNEARYRALFEHTLDGLLIVDDEGQIVDVNPAACQLLCPPGETLRHRPLSALQVCDEDGPPRPARWADFFSLPQTRGEWTLLRGDGTPGTIEYHAVSPFAAGLHLISLRDGTSRRQAEERARQSERLAAIGETMAALVHESRNALQRSKACLEMLRLELSDRPDVLDLVERAQRAQDDLHRLYEEVRQWAAPLVLKRQRCCLVALWREAWQQAVAAAAARTPRLEEHVAGPTDCLVDRFALIQVFRNIFENAIEVSPPDGVIQVRCQTTGSGPAEARVVAIRDQGPGLTPQQQQRIFDPFFTTKAKGTGLGMAIAQRIVQAHGGSIQAHVPGGTEIVVTLPTGEG